MRFRAWHASVVGFAVACAVVAGLAWLSFDRMNRLQEETARARSRRYQPGLDVAPKIARQPRAAEGAGGDLPRTRR